MVCVAEERVAVQVGRSVAEAQSREALNEARASSGVLRSGIRGIELLASCGAAHDAVANSMRLFEAARASRTVVSRYIRSIYPEAVFAGEHAILHTSDPPPPPGVAPPIPDFPIHPLPLGYVPPLVPTDFNPAGIIPRPPMLPGYVPPHNATAPAMPVMPPPTTPRPPPMLPGGM